MMIMRLLVSKIRKHRSCAHNWETGNAYVEYFVIASIVLLATLAFYNNYLQREGMGVRLSVEQAFDNLCFLTLGATCGPTYPY